MAGDVSPVAMFPNSEMDHSRRWALGKLTTILTRLWGMATGLPSSRKRYSRLSGTWQRSRLRYVVINIFQIRELTALVLATAPKSAAVLRTVLPGHSCLSKFWLKLSWIYSLFEGQISAGWRTLAWMHSSATIGFGESPVRVSMKFDFQSFHSSVSKYSPLTASCCSTCTCENLAECSTEFSSTPPFWGTVHQMPNTITDTGVNHSRMCLCKCKTEGSWHSSDQTHLNFWHCLRPLRACFSPCGGQTGGTMRSTFSKCFRNLFSNYVVLGASLAVYSTIQGQPRCYDLFWQSMLIAHQTHSSHPIIIIFIVIIIHLINNIIL